MSPGLDSRLPVTLYRINSIELAWITRAILVHLLSSVFIAMLELIPILNSACAFTLCCPSWDQ